MLLTRRVGHMKSDRNYLPRATARPCVESEIQDNFEEELRNKNVIFRIPTPVFGVRSLPFLFGCAVLFVLKPDDDIADSDSVNPCSNPGRPARNPPQIAAYL